MSFDPNTPPPPPPKTSNHQENLRPLSSARSTSSAPSYSLAPGQGSTGPSSYDPYARAEDGRPRQQQAPVIQQALAVPDALKTKTKDDLECVLHSPALLSALGETQFRSRDSPQDTLHAYLDANMALAQSIQQLEAKLAVQRESTQTHLLRLHGMDRQWRDKQKQMDSSIEQFAPKALYQQLNLAVGEAGQICDALEETFLSGDGKATEKEITDFLKGYKEGRKRWYLRKEKKERWDEGRVGGWP